MSKTIDNYHAHLYFKEEQIDTVHKVLEKVNSQFDFEIGRVWGSPVGPHPIGSCQILVPTENFSEFIPWLMQNREGIDIFVHANTGDDLIDHTEFIMWLGKSYDLNTKMFSTENHA